jgi:hypothetical protein
VSGLGWFETIRKWVSILGVSLGMFGFYSFLAATFFKYVVHVAEDYVLWCGAPFGLGVVWYMWPKLPEVLGFEGNLYKK